MAFKSESTGQSVAASTETVVYDGAGSGVPNATGAVLIGLCAANIGTVTVTVDLYKRVGTSSATGLASADNIFIVKNVPIPAGSSLEAVSAKVVLNQTDKIYVNASVANTVQVTASILENS